MFPPLKEKLRFRGGAAKKSKRESVKGHEVDHPLRKPLYVLSFVIVLIFGYFVLFNGQSGSEDPSALHAAVIINESTGFSTRTHKLYRDFLQQVKVSRQNTPRVLKNKLTLPGNPLFTRTKTVQMLFDYAQSATFDLYATEYAADPNYHYVECVETFAPHSKETLPKIEVAVREFLHGGGSMYSQDVIQSHCEKVLVTEELQQGLKVWPGQHGLVAREDLPAFTCIGHYYGDEYILNEYEKQFDWSIYGKKSNHPWRRKWDFYLTIPYHSFADERLQIPENVTVAIDAYHAYNYSAYISEGGQELDWEQSKVKMGNLEELINDPRKDLYKAKMWPEDLERKNTEFVYCSVDGVLQTFVVTTKPVEKAKQLFIYYGPNYG